MIGIIQMCQDLTYTRLAARLANHRTGDVKGFSSRDFG